jgi:predicted aldo/keto reductase-like oxidoreductase
MIRRAPQAEQLTEHWQKEMAKIKNCRHCNQCKEKCPYGLDTPTLLEKNWEDYQTFLK